MMDDDIKNLRRLLKYNFVSKRNLQMFGQEELKNLKVKVLRELSVILTPYPDLEWSFYCEFDRRFEVIEYLVKYVSNDARVCDLGSQPFILAAMIKLLGYDVISVDIDPDRYGEIARCFQIPIVKADLESDKIAIDNEACDCVIFTEVLEHLNPYYVNHTLAEINRVLKKDGLLILTTPNIASFFRRLKLLLGKNPIYRYHVREYVRDEVKRLLRDTGFKVVEMFHSDVNDRTYLHPRNKQELRKLTEVDSFTDMLRFTVKNINTTNVTKTLVYPLLRLVPSYRMLIVAIAKKVSGVEKMEPIERWG